jgi:hypothetical protein
VTIITVLRGNNSRVVSFGIVFNVMVNAGTILTDDGKRGKQINDEGVWNCFSGYVKRGHDFA